MKTEFSERLQEAENCRALWLSVILQALTDSEKNNFRNRFDLPFLVKTEWWKQLFIFAGIENDCSLVTEIILKNCSRDRKKTEQNPTKKFKTSYRRSK